MNRFALLLVLALALPAQAQARSAKQGSVKHRSACVAQVAKKPSARRGMRPASKTGIKARPSAKQVAFARANEVPKPSASDPDRERIEKLQDELESVVRGRVLGRLRVGMQVESLTNGRILFSWRSHALMDPASNQKVLATTTALLRLGNRYRYRTEVTGSLPDRNGTIMGNIVIRGSGDPSLRQRHIEELAEDLARAGVTRVNGAVLGDPRRIGSDEYIPSERAPLRVGGSTIEVRVRPSDKDGTRPAITIYPPSDAFVVINQAQTRRKGRTRLRAEIVRAGGRFKVTVGGRISVGRGEAVLHRAPPSPSLYAAVLLRHAISQAGVVVQGPAGIYATEPDALVSDMGILEGAMLASTTPQRSDSPVPLAKLPAEPMDILAVHESAPLPLLLRRVNKYSDNEWAERVLETVGAEVLGGVPNLSKGLRVLRESLTELGIPPDTYTPANGSGLGHHNRVTAAGMAKLLHRLYFDPRVGPEIMQSLSVGGVDGTTRNRFRGTSAAHLVRAKTGTLRGVSCLSGFVGQGSDILAFSILVEGHRKRATGAVRAAQVSAVNAMMRFSSQVATVPTEDEGVGGIDYENGEELDKPEATPGETKR